MYSSYKSFNNLTVPFGAAKINQFDHAPGSDHYIGTLDVAMNDPVVMQVGQPLCYLTGVVRDGSFIQRTKPVPLYITRIVKADVPFEDAL